MLHGLGTESQSTAAEIVADEMEACRNAGLHLPSLGQAAPGRSYPGRCNKKNKRSKRNRPNVVILKTYL